MRGWNAIAVIALLGCGSAAQGSAPIQALPQQVTQSIDASDGGIVIIGGSCAPAMLRDDNERELVGQPPRVAGDCGGGSMWLDARSGSAAAQTDQLGQHIDSNVEGAASVASSAQGNAQSGAVPAPSEPAPTEGGSP